MLFIGFALVGGGGKSVPSSPQVSKEKGPAVSDQYCEVQGLYDYDDVTVATWADAAAAMSLLVKMNEIGGALGQKVTLNFYAFSSIDGESRHNIALSTRRARQLRSVFKDAIKTGAFPNVKIGEAKGYGTTEVWGAVDRAKYNEAKKKGSAAFQAFVKSDSSLRTNRRYIISTRKIPEPQLGWDLAKQLNGAGTGPSGALCSLSEKKVPSVPKLTCGNGKVDEGEACDPKATTDTCVFGQKCQKDCTCGEGAGAKSCICPFGFMYKWIGMEPCSWHWLLKIPLCWWPFLLLLLIFRKKKSKTVRVWNIIMAKKEYKEKMEALMLHKEQLVDQIPGQAGAGGAGAAGGARGGGAGTPQLDPDVQARALAAALKSHISSATTTPTDVDMTRVMQKPGEDVEHEKCKSFMAIVADKTFKENDKGLKILFDYLSAFNISKTTAALACKVFKKYREDHGRDVTNFDANLVGVVKHFVDQRAEMALLHDFFVLQEHLLDKTKRFQARDVDDTYTLVEQLEKEEKRSWRSLWFKKSTRSFKKSSHEKRVDANGNVVEVHKTPRGAVGILQPTNDVNDLCKQLRHIASRLLKDYAGTVKGTVRESKLHELTDQDIHNIVDLWNKEKAVWLQLKQKIDEQENGLRRVLEVTMTEPPGLEISSNMSTYTDEDEEVTFAADIEGGIPPYEVRWVWGTRVGDDNYAVLHTRIIQAHEVHQPQGERPSVRVELKRRLSDGLDPALNGHLPQGTDMSPLASFYHARHSREKFNVGLVVIDNHGAPEDERQRRDSVVPIKIKRKKTEQGPPELWVDFNDCRPHGPPLDRTNWEFGARAERNPVVGQWIGPPSTAGAPWWFSGAFNPPGATGIQDMILRVSNSGGTSRLKYRLSIYRMVGGQAAPGDPEENPSEWLAHRILVYQGKTDQWVPFRHRADAEGYVTQSLAHNKKWVMSTYFRVPQGKTGVYYVMMKVKDADGNELDHNYIQFRIGQPSGQVSPAQSPGSYLVQNGNELNELHDHIKGFVEQAWANALKAGDQGGLSDAVKQSVDKACGTGLAAGKVPEREYIELMRKHLEKKKSKEEQYLHTLISITKLVLPEDNIKVMTDQLNYMKELVESNTIPKELHKKDAALKISLNAIRQYCESILRDNKSLREAKKKIIYAPRDQLLEGDMPKKAENMIEACKSLIKLIPEHVESKNKPGKTVTDAPRPKKVKKETDNNDEKEEKGTEEIKLDAAKMIDDLNSYQDRLQKTKGRKKPAQKAYKLTAGKGKVLLSAPHAALHIRNGKDKSSDIFTGAIVQVLHDVLGCPIIVQNYKAEDPNYYDTISKGMLHPFKKALADYLNKHPEINLVLDIHGMSDDHGSAVDLGKGGGRFKDPGLVAKNWFDRLKKDMVVTKDIFSASGQNTVTKFVHELPDNPKFPNVNKNIESMQIEIGAAYRGENYPAETEAKRKERIDKYKDRQAQMLKELVNIIKKIM